jgi:hypothetical protein
MAKLPELVFEVKNRCIRELENEKKKQEVVRAWLLRWS